MSAFINVAALLILVAVVGLSTGLSDPAEKRRNDPVNAWWFR